MRRLILAAGIVALVAASAGPARAQVIVERHGSENGMGIYDAATRPAPTAMLELDGGALRPHALPTVVAEPGGGRAYLISTRF